MSYILDALKKAAEQRSGPPPEVRRLLSAAPVAAASRSRYVTLAAAAAGAIAVAAIVWMWPPADDVPASTPKPVASVVAASTPNDRPLAPAQGDKPRTPIGSPASGNALRTTSLERRAVATKTPIADTKPPRTKPLGVASPTPAPIVASLPPTPAPAAPRTDISKLKVEVIVYSDQRPQRWAFISGRKYVEGDTLGDGVRIEEIQSTGVVLVEDGRRITLRP